MSIAERHLKMLALLPQHKGCHDTGHTHHVLLLANRLAESEGLTEQEQELLFEAVLYHDTGRTDDTENVQHGAAGYRIYLEEHAPNDVIEFLIHYHSYPDSAGLAALQAHSKSLPPDRLLLLFQIIKDADALDRVRFGPGALDCRFLRLEASLQLIGYAKELLESCWE